MSTLVLAEVAHDDAHDGDEEVDEDEGHDHVEEVEQPDGQVAAHALAAVKQLQMERLDLVHESAVAVTHIRRV